jgi:hypothetical protein
MPGDNILTHTKFTEAARQNHESSRSAAPTLQESTLEADLWQAEQLIRRLEANVKGLRKLRHIDAGSQLAEWSRRLFHLSFEVL